MEEILLANAAIALLEKLIPVIQARVKAGQVSPAEQQALHDKYMSLKNAGDAAFTGPEWQIE